MKKLFLIGLFLSTWLQADPLEDLKLVGQGEMNWVFWKLYDAQFYSVTGTYNESEYPIALALTYARDIEKTHLIEATIREWQRLDIEWQHSWLETLDKIWPSVESGDQLICLVQGTGEATFFLNGQPIGLVPDPQFADKFLAIWLSPHARDGLLRARLIGDKDT